MYVCMYVVSLSWGSCLLRHISVRVRPWWRHQMSNQVKSKWKHFPRYRPFLRWIHRSPVNFPHKGQWRGTLMFSLICAWTNGWMNTRDAGDLRRHSTHYDITVMHWDLCYEALIYMMILVSFPFSDKAVDFRVRIADTTGQYLTSLHMAISTWYSRMPL